MKTRLFVIASLVPFLFVAVTNAGEYQRTSDGQAYVWNNYPTAGDSASWSGGTDSHGYATGPGTLTWYKNGEWTSRYSGTMVKGRLNGFVTNQDADGTRYRGTYVNGAKSADWAQVTVAETGTSSVTSTSEPESIELTSAASAGYIDYAWAGVGSSTAMELHIVNRTEREWLIQVEVGTKLEPADGTAQSMVVTKELHVHAHPHESHDFEVQVACLDISKPPPSSNDVTWHTRTSSDLARFIACVRGVLNTELPNVPTDGILQMALWKARGATRDEWIDFFVHYQQMSSDQATQMAGLAEQISNAILQECPSI